MFSGSKGSEVTVESISTKYKDYYNNLGKEELAKMKEITKKTAPLYQYRGNTYKRNGGKYSLSRLALTIIKEYVAKQHSNLDRDY